MPGMSYTETIGFMDMVLASLEKLRNVLRKGGVDADRLIDIVRGLRDRAIDLNAKQEAHKRGLVATTAELEEVLHEAYDRASGALDTMIASVGKTSDDAKNLRRMRSNVLRERQTRKAARGKPPA